MRKTAYVLYYDENLSDNDFKDFIDQRIEDAESCYKELTKLYTKIGVLLYKLDS
jgi:hypothetical protein